MPAQVSAYDDPTLSWEAWNTPDNLNVDQADNNIFRLVAEAAVPRQAAAGRRGRRPRGRRRATQESAPSRSTSQAAVTRAYADLWLAHRAARIIGAIAILSIASRTPPRASTRSARRAQADVLRAQVELTHGSSPQRTAGSLRSTPPRAELNALLSRTPDAPLGEPEMPAVRRIETPLATLIERAARSSAPSWPASAP